LTFDELRIFVDAGLTQRQIALQCGCSQTNIRYWLRFHKLKTVGKKIEEKTTVIYTCVVCEKPFLDSSKRRRCQSCVTRIRRLRVKMAAIKLMGGKCVKCEWSGPVAGYDFHHFCGDKDFSIGEASNKSWNVIKQELKKCVLLCKICHAIEHSKQDDERLLAEVKNYRGTNLELED